MRSSLLRGVRGVITPVRMSSGFNKYPPLKLKPFGLSGNATLIIGAVLFTTAVAVVQKSGYLIPHAIGPGLSPVGRLQLDLTPDELKK